MKKYAVGLLILLFITGLTVLSQKYTADTVDGLQSNLDRMIELIEAGEFDECLTQLSKTSNYFSEREKVMAVYTSHLRLDEADTSLERLKAYLKKESVNDGLAEIYALQKRLNIILREEKITLENIL